MARASFSTLPLELKTRIVEMTRDQEEMWEDRVVNPRAEEHVGHINGLSSLALVNKELRSLAAKYQFKVLFSGRASLSIFRYHIFPRHGQHITDVRFGGKQGMEGPGIVLMILGQLSALRALRFTQAAATMLFGPGVTLLDNVDDDESSYRARMLAPIATKIESLALAKFRPSETVALVRRFPHLKMLYLEELKAFDDLEELKSLTNAMSGLRQLTHLIVDFPDDSEEGWPTEALGPLERDPPPIRILQLLWFPLDHHTFNLIQIFGGTLEALTLEVWSPEPEPVLSSRDPLQLPHLTSLHLIKNLPEGFDELIPLLLSPSSSISTLSFALTEGGWLDPPYMASPALIAALDSQPSLRRLQLGEMVAKPPIRKLPPSNDLASPSSIVAYADLVRSRGLDPRVLDRSHLSPFHRKAKLDYTANEAGFLKGALRRTLEFGLGELDRMFAEGSVARGVSWVAKLKALEDERLAWKD